MSIRNQHAMPFCKLCCCLPDEGGIKLDNLSTPDADEVIVWVAPGGLIVAVPFAQAAFLDQAHLLEDVESPVDRGQTDVRVARLDPVVERLHVEVLGAPRQLLEDEAPLLGQTSSLSVEEISQMVYFGTHLTHAANSPYRK